MVPVRQTGGHYVTSEDTVSGELSLSPQLDIGADATAALEHVPHGDGARQLGLAVVCDVHRHGQIQLLLLHAAVADPLASVPQSVRLVVQLGGRGLGLRGLQVKGELIVGAGGAEGLRARQFSGQGGGGEQSGAIGDGGGGSSGRHNVVIGVDRRETGRDGKVWLLLLRLGLFFFTTIILQPTVAQDCDDKE